MPLVAHNGLPTFQRLKDSGEVVLSLERATKQDIRELHIGFLNMMPDAALTATEAQFIRFIGACNQIAQIYVYPFSIPELNRGAKAQAHIAEHYFDFETLALFLWSILQRLAYLNKFLRVSFASTHTPCVTL